MARREPAPLTIPSLSWESGRRGCWVSISSPRESDLPRPEWGASRQQQTATEVGAAYADAGISFPAVSVDPAWDEFDLSRVYREIAPRLSAEDSEFRREYEEMREQVRISKGAHAARIHRKWLPCDTKLVEAWVGGRYPYSGETWNQFRERVAACRSKISDARENIVIVTSATPVAICTGLSLEISDAGVMRLAGACTTHLTQSCV